MEESFKQLFKVTKRNGADFHRDCREVTYGVYLLVFFLSSGFMPEFRRGWTGRIRKLTTAAELAAAKKKKRRFFGRAKYSLGGVDHRISRNDINHFHHLNETIKDGYNVPGDLPLIPSSQVEGRCIRWRPLRTMFSIQGVSLGFALSSRVGLRDVPKSIHFRCSLPSFRGFNVILNEWENIILEFKIWKGKVLREQLKGVRKRQWSKRICLDHLTNSWFSVNWTACVRDGCKSVDRLLSSKVCQQSKRIRG